MQCVDRPSTCALQSSAACGGRDGAGGLSDNFQAFPCARCCERPAALGGSNAAATCSISATEQRRTCAYRRSSDAKHDWSRLRDEEALTPALHACPGSAIFLRDWLKLVCPDADLPADGFIPERKATACPKWTP